MHKINVPSREKDDLGSVLEVKVSLKLGLGKYCWLVGFVESSGHECI